MSQPVIPQRPSRSPQPTVDDPKVPPRSTRKFERSLSRDRENFARSPLNESPFQAPTYQSSNTRLSDGSGALRRPPSVASLPLVGQEGSEYASLEESRAMETSHDMHGLAAPNTTSKVSSDLPLHAPQASAGPGSTSRLAEAARLDYPSGGSSAPGSRPRSIVERPPSSVSRERPGSSADRKPWETDIPEIGVRVPMYKNAGDVQAPTPGPGSGPPASGIGFFNSGSRPVTSGSTSSRRKSAQFHVPPGSYGLHGHGVGPQDQFEKSWYEKHPEEAHKEEHGAYGPAVRSEPHDWTLSSEQLNKLVRDSGHRVNNSVTPNPTGHPSEQIGYIASEKYASRSNSPKPAPLSKTVSKTDSRSGSGTFADSPLRQADLAEQALSPPNALDNEDEGAHADALLRRGDGNLLDSHTSDHASRIANDGGWVQGIGNTPILASDEIAKNPQGWLVPAISPDAQKHAHDDDYFLGVDERGIPKYEKGYRSHSRSRSRNESSRPSSVHGVSGLSRFISHDEGSGTPLEEIEEFEPLFEDEESHPIKKTKSAIDRLKRPELEHRFPSRDIWEDTPDSLRLETTVDTPEEPASQKAPKSAPASALFESPETEALRRGEAVLPKPKLNPAVQADVAASRPGLRHRFPSSDIWEDTPDSQLYTTTVGEEQEPHIPVADKPTVPARPIKAHPAIPPRPTGLSKQMSPPDRKGPAIPERPKPKVSERAAAPADDIDQNVSQKARPAVPARPGGSNAKFASIKSSFMDDLNSRLQIGPKAPKPEEAQAPATEEEAVPLADARKARARGPARRKPAAQSSDVPTGLSLFSAVPVWSISPQKDLTVNSASPQPQDQQETDLEAFEAQRIGHPGDVPENSAPVKLSSAPVLAPDASTPQLAPSPPLAAVGNARDEVGSLAAAPARADHKDPAVPTLLDASAEAERQEELSRLPVAANIIPSEAAGENINAPSGIQKQPLLDEGVQTGEQRLVDAVHGEAGKQESATVILGGNARTGEDVIQ